MTPPGRNAAALALLGQGIQSPLPNQRYVYTEQWNLGLQHQFGQGLVIDAGYVGSHGVLTGYLETSRFGVGGASGVQDNNCISCEYSKSSFDVPNRMVVSYTVTLPFGRGHYLLGNANGFVDRLVNNWTLNGIATFQDGFPIAFQDATANPLVANFAAGNAGPGLPAGVTRPNYNPTTAGCNSTKTMPRRSYHQTS